jgi:hypothetical protein
MWSLLQTLTTKESVAEKAPFLCPSWPEILVKAQIQAWADSDDDESGQLLSKVNYPYAGEHSPFAARLCMFTEAPMRA